jgi:peptidoglycan/LPS O-acetylase OafA/YrhL
MLEVRNIVTVVTLGALIVLVQWLSESYAQTTEASWVILLAYLVLGAVSYLALRGSITRRVVSIGIVAFVATVAVELIFGSDPAYPLIRFIYVIPLAAVLMIGAVVGIAVERALKRSPSKEGKNQSGTV